MTEVWFRNPLTYIRECAELLYPRIIWDRGLLVKNRLDPTRHAEIHLPRVVDYRLLLVGDQGTAELRRGYPITKPFAVYPTWEYGRQSVDELESMMASQRIDDRASLPPDERAVPGQEHRVVVIRTPNANDPLGKAMNITLAELQADYPDCILHFHGTYSFRVAFGLGFGSADIDPVAWSSKGRVILGSGRAMVWERAAEFHGWVALNGFRHDDLAVARNRTMFNMRSAIWAGTNFNSEDTFRVRPGTRPIDAAAPVFVPEPTFRHFLAEPKPLPGDKFACDHCSLAPICKHHRDGGVCIIPDSDAKGLARYFQTRDSGRIIEGLGHLMEAQVERVERGMATERDSDELDPHITKMLKDIFDNGVRLAKLIDPKLNGGPKVGVFVNGGTATIASTTDRTMAELAAEAVRELEAKGVAREDIDARAVAEYIAGRHREAIEVSSRDVS